MLYSLSVQEDSPSTAFNCAFKLNFKKHVHQVLVEWFVPTTLLTLGALFLRAFCANYDFTGFAFLGLPHYVFADCAQKCVA